MKLLEWIRRSAEKCHDLALTLIQRGGKWPLYAFALGVSLLTLGLVGVWHLGGKFPEALYQEAPKTITTLKLLFYSLGIFVLILAVICGVILADMAGLRIRNKKQDNKPINKVRGKKRR